MPLQPPGVTRLGPVNTENMHQQVYNQLRHAIMSGSFRPGETLTLRPLAAAFGTSIIPARDALLRLVTERALETHRRSVRIPIMTLDEFRDVERMRILIEGETAAVAAERASSAEIAAIEQASARVEKAFQANRIDKFVAANQEFHFTIYRAAHNELWQSIIERLWLQIGPYLGFLLVSMKGQDLSAMVDGAPHARLIEAIKARDPAAARAALAADLEDSTDIYAPFRSQMLAQSA